MARLGELLVATGLLTADQVEQALRAQVMWGGRLGTNLIELGYLDLDTLSAALGRQHRLPAALARHFDKVDPELQKRLAVDIAERYSVVPIRASGPQKLVVYAAIGPLDKRAHALIAETLGVPVDHLIPSVAAELRIRYHLERAFKIPRGTRFLRARGGTVPPFPQFEIAAVTFEDLSEVDIPLPRSLDTGIEIPRLHDDDIPAEEATAEVYEALELLVETPPAPDDDLPITVDEVAFERAETGGRDRRRYVRTIADEPATESERQQALGRIAIRKVAHSAGQTLGEATRAIRRGTDRDLVADLVVSTLERFVPDCDAAILLVVRGGAAIGWKGFCRSAALPELGVPLDQPGLIPRAVSRGTTLRAPIGDLGAIDKLLMTSLGYDRGDLVAVPVAIAGRVMCVIAMVTVPDTPSVSAEGVAAAAGAAFTRLMRDATR